MNLSRFRLVPVALATALLVVACGGGGGDTPTTTISGTVVKGPVSSSTVCAFKAVATGKGDQLGCTTTGAGGTYSLSIGYQGDVVIEASGGSYTDEATNATRTLADPMQVVLSAAGGTATGVVTPLTAAAFTMAKAQSSVSSSGFTTAAASVASQFQLAGVNLATTVPSVSGTTNAYGNVLRAVSQFVANGNTLASVIALASPTTLQAGFGTAFATINGSNVAFTFNGGTTPTGATGSTTTGSGNTGSTGTGSTSTGSTGTGSTGSTSSSTRTLVVTVTVSGVTTSSTINNVPAPSTQAQFCDGLAADTTFTQLATTGGGSFTINSCSFNGTTGNIAATLRIAGPIAVTVPYTITYTYR